MLDKINKKVVKALLMEIRRSVCLCLPGMLVCTLGMYSRFVFSDISMEKRPISV